jgi:outer membrane protein OmpA-like peptidoglycan-associated protein
MSWLRAILAATLLAGPASAALQQAPPLHPDPYAGAPPGAHVDVGPFLVFFAPRSSAIDAQAAGVIGSFVGLIQHGHADPPLIIVTGAADRAGSEAANLATSCRRAKAVRQWMLDQGLATRRIVAIGVGETKPLVHTPDGQAEPQNRYAMIGIAESLRERSEGGILCSDGGYMAGGERR